jgi:hypothetical protein
VIPPSLPLAIYGPSWHPLRPQDRATIGELAVYWSVASVDIFHHKSDNINMSVVEMDAVVSGMLVEELERCEEALAGIEKVLSEIPKGALNVRKRFTKARNTIIIT